MWRIIRIVPKDVIELPGVPLLAAVENSWLEYVSCTSTLRMPPFLTANDMFPFLQFLIPPNAKL